MTIRSPLRSPLRVPLRVPLRPPIARGFSPLDLFAAGEQGAWYEPSDMSTLFQDSAGTIPVTAVEQPVGMVKDKSGRGNHLIQATAGSRPTLKQNGAAFYLDFDGTDDGMVTVGSVNFTATDKMTVCAGLTKRSDAATGFVVELTANSSSTAGSFGLLAPTGAGAADYQYRSGGSITGNGKTASGLAAPNTSVITGVSDISGDYVHIRVNGVTQGAQVSADQGTGNYANAAMFIGRRGGTTLPVNGSLFGLIVRGAQSTPAQISGMESYMASKMGPVAPVLP